MSVSQRDMILEHLRKYGSITPLEALDRFACFRLGARILELRKLGHPIETTPYTTPGGATVAKYVLRLPVYRPMTEQLSVAL